MNFTSTVSTTGLCSTLGSKFSDRCFAPAFRDVVDFPSSRGMLSPSSVHVLCVLLCVLMRIFLYMIFIKLELFVNPRTPNRKHTLTYINKCKCLRPLDTMRVTLHFYNDKVLHVIFNISWSDIVVCTDLGHPEMSWHFWQCSSHISERSGSPFCCTLWNTLCLIFEHFHMNWLV